MIETRFQGAGWAYGNDLHCGERLPTTNVVSGNICRLLGWVQLPWLNRTFADNAVLALGRSLNRIAYVPEVVIEHRHPSLGKSGPDDIYRQGKSTVRYYRDRFVFNYWRLVLLHRDQRLIQRSLLQ